MWKRFRFRFLQTISETTNTTICVVVLMNTHMMEFTDWKLEKCVNS